MITNKVGKLVPTETDRLALTQAFKRQHPLPSNWDRDAVEVITFKDGFFSGLEHAECKVQTLYAALKRLVASESGCLDCGYSEDGSPCKRPSCAYWAAKQTLHTVKPVVDVSQKSKRAEEYVSKRRRLDIELEVTVNGRVVTCILSDNRYHVIDGDKSYDCSWDQLPLEIRNKLNIS